MTIYGLETPAYADVNDHNGIQSVLAQTMKVKISTVTNNNILKCSM